MFKKLSKIFWIITLSIFFLKSRNVESVIIEIANMTEDLINIIRNDTVLHSLTANRSYSFEINEINMLDYIEEYRLINFEGLNHNRFAYSYIVGQEPNRINIISKNMRFAVDDYQVIYFAIDSSGNTSSSENNDN